MFVSKSSLDKILKIHYRIAQIVYDVYNESYENLLNGSDDVSIHQIHLGYLAIEVCKCLTKINIGFMWNFFEQNHTLIIYDEETYYTFYLLILLVMFIFFNLHYFH